MSFHTELALPTISDPAQVSRQMDQLATIERLVGWDEEESESEPKLVTGSVVEFAFGDAPHAYFATSYPYRAEYADTSDTRTMTQLNMPFVREKLKQIKPRYIMNVAIRSPDSWFLYCYRGPGRFAYDAKWFPRKPSKADGLIGEQLDYLKEEEIDQLSYCAFGESSKSYFLRATDRKKDWHPRLSGHVPTDLLHAYQDEFKRGCPRAVTFGKGRTWIVYGKLSFKWSRQGLPRSLETALRKGIEEGWTINKAVLNRTNRKEYVLVYNEGPVYYSFHRDFVIPFKIVIDEWSAGMRSCGKSPDHKAIFPFEHQYDNEDEGDSDVAYSESATDDNGDDDNHISKQHKHAGKGKQRHETSSTSNASAHEASGSSDRPRANSDDIGIVPNPVQNPLRPTSPLQTPFVTASSSTERVPNQQQPQRSGPELPPEPRADEAQPQPPQYTPTPQRKRGQSRVQTFKEGFRGLFS